MCIPLNRLVMSFLRYLYIMWMTFSEPSIRNSCKLSILAECLDCCCTTIAHSRPQSSYQLMNSVCQWSFISDTPFNSFRDKFIRFCGILEITIFRTCFHCPNRTHAPINFVLSTLEDL